MSETENGRLDLYDTENSKCNHLMTLGFKGLEWWHAAAHFRLISLPVWCIIITQLFSIIMLCSGISCWHLLWLFPLLSKPSFAQSLSRHRQIPWNSL